MMRTSAAVAWLAVLLSCLVACAGPQVQPRGDFPPVAAQFGEDALLMPDGYHLPLRQWRPADRPRALVLALHGFNDYSNAFDSTARYLTGQSIAIAAIDQRGFGRSAQTGLWAGQDVMQADLVTAVELLCNRHPELPLYLLGESMGGAVILGAAAELETTCISGIVLAAPAVWGWETMPWWQGVALSMLAHTFPAMKVTGEGLDIRPSDNIEMLRALGRDPLVIKETRIDTVYGLTNLMQTAFENSPHLHLPVLLLYGEQDEIITPLPVCRMLGRLGDFRNNGWRMLLYPEGFHMLTRDLQAEVVLRDITAWIGNRTGDAPSGQEVDPDTERLRQLCGRHLSG